MKLTKSTFQGFKSLLVLIFLMGSSTSVYAKNDHCWADFFEDPHYAGESFRVKGSAELKDLLNVNGENWDKRIESIKVGSKAVLTVFENKNLKLTLTEMAKHPVLMKSLGITQQDILEDSELIFQPGTKVHNLGDFTFYHKIRSLKLVCVK